MSEHSEDQLVCDFSTEVSQRGGQKDRGARAGQKGTEEGKGLKTGILQLSKPLADLLPAGRPSEEEKIGPGSSSLWYLPCAWIVEKAGSTVRAAWQGQK